MLGEELDSCNIKLLELDASVQDFAEQNVPLAKQLANRIGKLTALHQQTIQQAEYRAAKLSQVWLQILSAVPFQKQKEHANFSFIFL